MTENKKQIERANLSHQKKAYMRMKDRERKAAVRLKVKASGSKYSPEHKQYESILWYFFRFQDQAAGNSFMTFSNPNPCDQKPNYQKKYPKQVITSKSLPLGLYLPWTIYLYFP